MTNKSPLVLNRVVDSLYLRVMRTLEPSDWLLSQFPVWSEYLANYEHGDAPLFVELDGVGTFRLMTFSRAPYALILDCPEVAHIRVWNPYKWSGKASHQTGQLFVDFRSSFLQRHGLDGVRRVIAALERLFYSDVVPEGVEYGAFVRVARCDLAVDVAEPDALDYSELSQYVCRSKTVDSWLDAEDVDAWVSKELGAGVTDTLKKGVSKLVSKVKDSLTSALQSQDEAAVSRVIVAGRDLSTVYFGRFGSQLYARRYDKLASLAKQNKLFMLDVWEKGGWDG